MNWQKNNKKLEKNFEFEDFKSALEFVTQVGELAEKAQHHPDLLIHNYNQVKISLTTHDADGVTEKDYDLAKKIDSQF